MPIYEYKCSACAEHTEVIQKMTDTPLTECPHCHAHELKRKVSAASFHLKGTGWYQTDFKNKDQKPEQTKEPSEKTKQATESSTSNKTSETKQKTDSKKDPKSE